MTPGELKDRKVALTTLGCKLNQYDSEMVLTQFRSAGYSTTDNPADADICIVNTCAVTSTAERKARAALRAMHRKNPHAQLMAIGCMAERTPDSLAAITGVTTVLGNREKESILHFVGDSTPRVSIGGVADAITWTDATLVDGLLGRTRAYLKVQDGCSQHCTYCIVPRLRGRGRSLDIQSAVARAEHLVEQGFTEIVITGVALGTYGSDLDLPDGTAALLDALTQVHGLQRLRLGSIEPWAITERFLEIIAGSEIICPHLHIPLQSCEDSVLRRMNRRYTVADIARIFEQAYALRDDWGFGSDIIVGFPGESETEFDRTRDFLSGSPLSYLHVFPFSSRPGTPAARLPGHVTSEEKNTRVESLKALDSTLRERFREKHLGQRCRVLFEDRHVDGMLSGHTADYLDVYVRTDKDIAGRILEVEITELHPDGVIGTFEP